MSKKYSDALAGRKSLAVALFCALIWIAFPAASRADGICYGVTGNLVQNCSFATKSFGDWNVADAASGSFLVVDSAAGPDLPNTGESFYALFGASGNEEDVISQALSTVPGATYSVTFYLYHRLTDDGKFEAAWDGTDLLDLVNVSAFPYTEETFDVTGTGSDTLSFGGYDGPSNFALDDVSVAEVSAAPVPEPSSLVLLGGALVCLAGTRKRRSYQS